ncbi:E3 ubiquitin-protein ligase KEG, partial [Glycine soja]
VILVAGVDVNIRNMHNGIPLHIALARGAKSCVELLLSIGANCNVQVFIQVPNLLCFSTVLHEV